MAVTPLERLIDDFTLAFQLRHQEELYLYDEIESQSHHQGHGRVREPWHRTEGPIRSRTSRKVFQMNGFVIRKAERHQARLRLGLCGPSGSGKTMSALLLAKGLVSGTDGKIGLIDTERQSASLYAHVTDFDVINLAPPYSPERYREALRAMEQHVGPSGVVILDQISHAWSGEGGLLEYVDTLKAQSRNALSPWMKATPEQNRLVDSLLRSPCHIIATMRAKSEWVMEEQIIDGRKKNVPRKIGLAPVQRDGIEYEFTTMLDLDVGSNTATASKDRSSLFAGITAKLDEEWGVRLREWLLTGTPDIVEEPLKQAPDEAEPIDPVLIVEHDKKAANWKNALEKCDSLDALAGIFEAMKTDVEPWATNEHVAMLTTAKNARARELVAAAKGNGKENRAAA